MSENEKINDGGLQTAVQYVYLDFDGESTSYNGEILTVDRVEVQDSSLTEERIASIVADLNARYGAKNVLFVTERPENSFYSTIYVGKTDSFAPWGSFTGLAETIDKENLNKSDNAFVMLDSTSAHEDIVAAIAHETDHLLGTLDHGGEGLEAYAIHNIFSGETSTGVTLYYDSMYVSNGGTANSTTVNSSGFLYVSSGGTANNTTVNSGGLLLVDYGAAADNTTVNYWGDLDVNGGTANNTTVNSGGAMIVWEGTANSTTVTGGSMRVGDGTANCTTINNGGSLEVYASGTANSATVTQGSMCVYDGGTANNIVLNSKGFMDVHYKATANNTTITHGSMDVYDGGTANSTTITHGSMWVYDGGTANSTTVNSGGVLYISSAGMAEDTHINAQGSMHISSDGSASEILVESDGQLSIYGSAWHVVLNEGASLTNGGISAISGYTGNIGYFTRGSGGYQLGDSNSNLAFSMACTLADGATLDHAVVYAGGGLIVNSGCQVTNITLENGKLTLRDGAAVSDVYVNNTSTGMVDLTAYSGSITNVNLQNSGCIWGPDGRKIYALSGYSGHIDNLIVSGNAISWQGKAEYIRLAGGSAPITIREGALLENSELAVDPNVAVSSGAVITDSWQTSGCVLFYSGAVVSNYTVLGGWADAMNGSVTGLKLANGAYFKVYSSGSVSDVNIEDKSHLFVGSGTAENVFISSGGSMLISSGGFAKNTLQIESGAYVSAYEGAVIDFTVSKHSVNGGFLINDLSLIFGAPAYTITVSADQALGEYKLAQGAEYFAGTLSIGDGSVNYGTITVNGEEFVYNSKYYNLKADSGDLTLTIADTPAIPPPVIVYSSGAIVSSGTVMTNVTLGYSGGNSMEVSSGGTANSTTVSFGGVILVSSGGTANSTTVISGGSMLISSGANIFDTTVSRGGYITIARDAVVSGLTVESRGTLFLTQGAVSAYGLAIADGARLFLTLNSKTYLQGTSNGSAFEVKEGRISGFNFSDGRLNLQNSCFAQNISAQGSASIIVNKNAVIESTFFQSGISTSDSAGKIILSGGTARYTSLTDRAGMEVGSGTASDTYLVNYAYLKVYSGTSAIGTQIDQFGSMYVASGARAEHTIINSGGSVYFDTGAEVVDTIVNSGGHVSLHYAEGVTVNNGGFVSFGGYAKDVLINSGGTGFFAAGSAENAIVVSSGGKVEHVANGSYTGEFDLKAGGIFMGFSFADDKELAFTSGTSTYLAPQVRLEPYYYGNYEHMMRILSNGSMSNFTAHSANVVHMMSSSYAENFVLDGAYMRVLGATASNVVIQNCGSAMVNSSGAVRNVTVNGSCIIVASTGGVIDGAVTSNGSAWITANSGGILKNAVINENGILSVNSGAVAENIEQRLSGRMRLKESATLTGNQTWGGQVYIYGTVDASAANIELDVSDHTVSDKIIIRGYKFLEGVENLTITVNAQQELGSYKLASGIENFTASVTVKDTDDNVYGLIQAGSSIMIGEHVCTLVLDKTNDLLYLFVENDMTAPVISKLSISQGEAYKFTAEISARDDFSRENELTYSIRWAESADALAAKEFIAGNEFFLSAQDAGKEFFYQVSAVDKSGNTSLSAVKSFIAEDRTAPELSGSAAVRYDNYTLRFDWDQASDNCGNVSYQLTVNGVLYHTNENYLILGNALPGVYNYELRAADKAGNVSCDSISGTVNIAGRAELAVESLQVMKEGNAVSSVFADEETTVAVTISNSGSAAVADAQVKIYCGGILLAAAAAGSIAADETIQIHCTLPADSMKAGLNELKVLVDTGSTFDEYSKLNNEKTASLLVEERKMSDLVIGSIALDKAMYALGETAKLTFTVKNIGYGSSKAAVAALYDGGTLLGYINISALNSGETSALMSFDIPTGALSAGTHLLRLAADAENLETESSEFNNETTINMVIGGCDLNLNRLDLSSYDCSTKDDLTVRFTVTNSGTVSAGSFRVSFYDGENYLGSTIITEELAAGFSISGQYLIKAGLLAPGVHNIKAFAVLDGSIIETSNFNNMLSAQLEVFYKDEEAPVLSDLTLFQSADGYFFTFNAAAEDNVSAPGELTWALRYAESESALANGEFIAGNTFVLEPSQVGKTFYCQLAVTDSSGNTVWSDVKSVTVADTTGPEIKNIKVNADDGIFHLSWEGVDNVQISHYNIYVDNVLQATLTTPSFTIENVENPNHTYRIEAFDINGNSSSTADLEMADETAPGITYLSIRQLPGSYDFEISVRAADDFTPEDKILYSVKYAMSEELLAQAAVSGDLTFVLSENAAGGTLYYQIGASDATGNIFWSSVRTIQVSDMTAPGKGTGLDTEVSNSQVTLQWDSAIDNAAVDGYNVRYGLSSDLSGYGVWTTGTSLSLDNLAPGKYFWQISAIDSSGNIGEWSDCASFTIFEADPYENNNTALQAFDLGVLAGSSIIAGGSISSSDDEDWFSITLESKGVSGDFISIDFDAFEGALGLYLFSADGTKQLLAAANGTLALDTAAAGTYLVKVAGINGARNSYTLQTQKVTEYVLDINDASGGNNSMANATIIDISANPSGSLEAMNIHSRHDTDFYQFTLTGIGQSNESVSISFKHKSGDLDLYLLNSAGEVIDKSIKTGNNEKISFKGLSAGTYYVQVVSPYGAGNEYDLSWKFASREVKADIYEGKEPLQISSSCTLSGLTISKEGKDSSREDTFVIQLDRKGTSGSKIRFSSYNSSWKGLQYTLRDSSGNTVRTGIGSELSLNGVAAGSYTLTVDTPVDGSCGSYDMSVSLPEVAGDTWAVFVYMAADNNLDQYAMNTLLEMQKTHLDAGVEVYILLDRAASGSWSDTRVGKLCYSAKDSVDIVWESWGELNTGSPATLERFLDWGVNQAPDSENYALIMWNHGGGIAQSMSDDSSNSQGMLPHQIADAVKNSSANISVIGFDACLMSMAEVLSCFDGITEYFVGSEDMEGSGGWNWSEFLADIKGGMSPEEFAAAIVESAAEASSISVLTAIKTDGTVSEAMSRFASASADFSAEEWAILCRAFVLSAFGGTAVDNSQSQLYSYADLITAVNYMLEFKESSALFTEAASELKNSILKAIVKNCTNSNSEGKGGISFYPGIDVNSQYDLYPQLLKQELEATPLGQNSSWLNFIDKLAESAEQCLDAKLQQVSSTLRTKEIITSTNTFTAADLGAFSGSGFSVTADDFFTVNNTRVFMFDVTDACNADDAIVITTLLEHGSFSISLYDSAMQKLIASVRSQNGTAVLDLDALAPQSSYVFTVETDVWQSYTIEFAGSTLTGCDYYDYSSTGTNDKNVNGNSCIDKASNVGDGVHAGLITYAGDSDWFSCGGRLGEEKLITVTGSGLTVSEYDAEGNWVQDAVYSSGVYTMKAGAANYLRIEGSADIDQNEINTYQLTITNIYNTINRVLPELVISGNAAEWTNKDVILSAAVEKGGSGVTIYCKKSGSSQFQKYTGAITVTENSTWIFYAVDALGNKTEEQTVIVDKIDKTAPESPKVSADITDPTNQDVTVSAVFSSDSVIREYSFDNQTWYSCTGSICMAENGKVYFRGKDAAGNISQITGYEVANIDRTAPEKPSVTQSSNELTNENVTVTAHFSSDCVVKEYSIDGKEWFTYTGPVLMTENGTLCFRGKDAAGNWSEVTHCEITNIDKEKPALKIIGNPVEWTNKDVVLIAIVSDETVMFYNGTTWVKGAEQTVTANGTYIFRVTDQAGNVAERIVIVDKIDKTAPEKPEVSADITEPTNQNVTVSAAFSSDSVIREYSFDNQTWYSCTGSICMAENGKVYFRGTDAAGNISQAASYEVANIDRTAPEKPSVILSTSGPTKENVTVTAYFSSDCVVKEYSHDGKEWFTYTGPVLMTENGTLYFRGKDAAGNCSEAAYCEVSNIDKTAPEKPSVILSTSGPTKENVTVTAHFSSDCVVKEYSHDGKEWFTYTGPILMTENGTLCFRGKDAAGNCSEAAYCEVSNIDKEPPSLEISGNPVEWTNQDVVLTAAAGDGSIMFYNGTSWVEGAEQTVSTNGTYIFRVTDKAGNITEQTVIVDRIDRTVSAPEEINVNISGNAVTLDWADIPDESGVEGYYIRYGSGENLTGNGIFISDSEFSLTDIATGTCWYQVRSKDKAGNLSDWSDCRSFEKGFAEITDLKGDCNGLSWAEIPGAQGYIVEISAKETFADVLSFETTSCGLDTLVLPDGTWYWRVKAVGSDAAGTGIVSGYSASEPQKFGAVKDSITDVFFAVAKETWGAGYAAQHTGVRNGWSGTKEQVILEGKNRISDVFAGSGDASVLVLSDKGKGDVLFLDDIYSNYGDKARLEQISEIRAGAGDDIVDMTSARYEYIGQGVTIYGGSGNDTIWANNGRNTLFGDAGNDRIVGGSDNDIIIGGAGNDSMHGGGGKDIFCFGANWGEDTIEQLSGDTVTLWFSDISSEDELIKNSTGKLLIYSDGKGSRVTVSGTTDVNLKFGDTEEAVKGSFLDAASERIFEDKNKGTLA